MNAAHIKIFVMTHKLDMLPSIYSNQIYETVQCGTDVDGHIKLKTQWHDNDGQNVSKYNVQLNEMTGIWWVWKHLDIVAPNIDFIGLAQYRRYLDIPNNYLLDNKQILCGKMLMSMTIAEQFATCHYTHPLGIFFDYLKDIDPNLYRQIINWWCNSKILYRANLFVMPKHLFVNYGQFIDICIGIFMKIHTIIDVNKQFDAYQQRWMSFILERMTSFWLSNIEQSKNASLIDIPIIDIDIPNIENGTR